MTASVIHSLRKSCGVKVSGLPSAVLSPVAARAACRILRIAWAGIGRFSAP